MKGVKTKKSSTSLPSPPPPPLIMHVSTTNSSKYVTFHREPNHFKLGTAVTMRRDLRTFTTCFINCYKLSDVIIHFVFIWRVSQRISVVKMVFLKLILCGSVEVIKNSFLVYICPPPPPPLPPHLPHSFWG